jgi:hypothetical protein
MAPPARRVLILAGLAILTYLPALQLPFIADDYHQIPLARQYSAQGWTPLLHDLDERTRATYMVLSAVLDRTFGFTPLPFFIVSLLLHALCVLMVYAMSVWNEIDENVAFWAACFFAVFEGHQEAVMWLAASSDLLVFLFGMIAWVGWTKWLQGRGAWGWYLTAVVAFLLAAASKESVWIFPVLMLLPVFGEFIATRHWSWRGVLGVAPFFALAAIYIVWSWATRVAAPGYQDIRFSLSSPWPLVVLRSFWKLLFIWGLLALAVLWWAGKRSDWRLITFASLWMVFALVPYSFLTYMLQVPSRHTYVASAGLALLAGAAAVRLSQYRSRAPLIILSIFVIAVNLEILWVKKMAQFRERAEASELLKHAVANSSGPLVVDCVPFPDFLTEDVLKSVASSAVFTHPDQKVDSSCFAIEYTNRQGQVVLETRKLSAAKHGTFY